MTDNLGEAVVVVGADTSGFQQDVTAGVNSALGNASKQMQQVGKQMSSVGKQLSFSVTAPLVGIGIAAVNTQAQYEQTMSVLQASTGASQKAMAALGDQAKQLGADSVFSANEAAEAMLELGRAGFKTAQITKAVPEVINLAATEGLGLGDAAGIVSSALSQFQIQAGKSAEVVNALAGASNASRSSVASLSESLKLVGSAAAGIGLSVQETAGALAALSDSGLDGSIAGTSLASVFNRLVPQTDKAASAMRKLKLDFTDANGNFDDMNVIAGKLQTAFMNMNDEARKIAISKIFGKDASVIAAVNALIQAGSGGLKDYTEAASDMSAAQKLADARMSGTAGALERMQGALETAALSIGEALAPDITAVADMIGGLAEQFANLPAGMQTAIVVAAALAAALGPVLIVMGMLITAVGTIGAAFAGFSVVALAPILAVVAALIGLGIAIKQLWEENKEFRDGVLELWASIREGVTAVLRHLQAFWDKWGDEILTAAAAMWNMFKQTVLIAFNLVKGIIQGALDIILGVFDVFAGIFNGDWSRVWNGLGKIVSGAWTVIKSLFKAGIDSIVNLAKNLGPLLKDAILGALEGIGGWLVDAGKDLIGGLIDGVKSMFGDVKDTLGNLTSSLTSWKGPPSKDKVLLRPAGQQVIEGFVAGLEDAIPQVKSLLTGLTNGLSVAVASPQMGVTGSLTPATRAVGGSVGAPTPSVAGTAGAATAGLTGAYGGPLVEQNFYGPTTGADRLQEMDWALRFATGRTPVQVTAGGAG